MPEHGRPGPDVTRLIHRIRTLVAEGRSDNRREISRLQRQLANAVKRELKTT